MPDISSAILAAAGDPLVAILGLFVLGGLVTLLLFRKHPLGRAIVRVVLLIFLTFAFIRAGILPYQPLPSSGFAFRDAMYGILKIAWWLWAAWFVVGFLRAFVIVESRPRESKLLQDLLAGFIYLVAVFAIIAYVFDLPIKGLLATSGAVAIILGLALQSTLGDVFSGLVLSFSRPYLPGDWINIEGGTEGCVIEMNWRATHILTGRRDLAIVPNSTIAKSKIVNVSSPSGIHGVTVTVQLAPNTSPSAAREVINAAILNCRLILATPSPAVVVKSITARYSEFEITFFVEQLSSSTDAQNQLFDFIFRHLTAARIRLGWPQNLPDPGRDDLEIGRPASEVLVDLVDIFRPLTAAERHALAAKLTPTAHGEGETLVAPGEVVKSLFIVGAGVLSICRKGPDGDIELERLGPADHYGEVGILTGGAAVARIAALTPAIMYKLSKDDLAPVLKARPQVVHELSRTLARRQAEGRATESADVAEQVPADRLTVWFSERLHRFANLASAG